MTSRRDFFGSIAGLGKAKKEEGCFFPYAPFFNAELAETCKECENPTCTASCPEEIIKKSEKEPPILDFSKRGCTFCEECATSCLQNVFNTSNSKQIGAVLEINPSECLAWHNTICKSCFDPCPQKAIDFSGLFYPAINTEKCTACGFCVGICPANAITVKRSPS